MDIETRYEIDKRIRTLNDEITDIVDLLEWVKETLGFHAEDLRAMSVGVWKQRDKQE